MVRIRVHYGGHLPRVTGVQQEGIELDTILTLDSLLRMLHDKYKNFPEGNLFGDSGSFLITLNGSFIPSVQFEEIFVKTGDDLCLLPPVSGG